MGAKDRLLSRSGAPGGSGTAPAVVDVTQRQEEAAGGARSRLLSRGRDGGTTAPSSPPSTRRLAGRPNPAIERRTSAGERLTRILAGSPERAPERSGLMQNLESALDLLRRPGMAIQTGLREGAAAVPEDRTGPGQALAGLPQFIKGFGRGFGQGIRGQGTTNLVTDDYLANQPGARPDQLPLSIRALNFGFGTATDPLMYTGQFGGRLVGGAAKGALAATTSLETAGMAAQLLPAGAARLNQVLRPILRFGPQGAVSTYLRTARARVAGAGREGAEEAIALGQGLRPGEEAAARRLLERPASATVRQAVSDAIGGRVPAAVDVALDEAGAAFRPRRFRVASDPLERRLEAVLGEAAQDPALRATTAARQRLQQAMERLQPAADEISRLRDRASLRQARVQRLERGRTVAAAQSVGEVRDTARQMAREEAEGIRAGRRSFLARLGNRKVNPPPKGHPLRDEWDQLPQWLKAAISTGKRSRTGGSKLDEVIGDAGMALDEFVAQARALGRKPRTARELESIVADLLSRQEGSVTHQVQRRYPGLLGRAAGRAEELRPFSQIPQDPEEVTRLAAQVQGVDLTGLEAAARPGANLADEAVQAAAARRGLTADEVISAAARRPGDRVRRIAERARLARAAGVTERTLPRLARPASIPPREQVLDDAVQALAQRGVDEPVARAAVQGRDLTERIVRNARAAGLPLEGRGEYFPRVQKPVSPVQSLVKRITRGFFGGHDPHAEARTLAPELGIDELERLREAGENIPAYRTDFAIPLAIRNQRAREAVVAHEAIQEGFRRFGTPLGHRTPAELAQEGLVAVKYVPKNSDQPFQFARSAMPEDPENWVAVPQQLLRGLQTFHKQFIQDEGLAQVATIWRALHGVWKAGVTVIRPAFYFSNGAGGLVNNLLAGVTDPEAYTSALKAVAGKQGMLRTPAGDIPFAEALRLMEQEGVTSSGLTRSLFKANTLDDILGKKTVGRRVTDAAAGVETFNRAAIFFDRLMKGASPEDAALDTLATHFDYSNEALTGAERAVREFVPFLVWLKNNAEFQVKKFLERPQIYMAYLRGREQLSAPGRERRPTYQRSAIPLGIRFKNGNELVLQPTDPIADVVGLVEEPARKLGGAITPFVREPFEQIANRDFFTGQDIERFPGELKEVGPAYLPARTAHAVKAYGGALVPVAGAVASGATGQGDERDLAALLRFFIPGLGVADPQVAARERVRLIDDMLDDMRAEARQRARIERERDK